MKVRTLEHLADALADEMAWRRKELLQLKSDIALAPEHLVATRLRAGVALLYAHWECFVRAAVCVYVEYVEAKRLPYEGLGPEFLGLSLKGLIQELIAANSAHVHTDFARFLMTDLGTQARFARDHYEPNGILSSLALRDITGRVGIPYEPYELKANLIDSSLCAQRHQIAHGEVSLVDQAQYFSLHSEVVGMLNTFADALVDAALTASYARPAA